MGGFDNATWQALGLVTTLLGLGCSAYVWSRWGATRGLRAVAWSLLPLAAGLTGVLRLGWEIVDSVVRWATRLVFSPVVWIGLVVAAVSLLLFVVSGALARRGSSPARRRAARGRSGGDTAPAVPGAGAGSPQTSALPRGRSRAAPSRAGSEDMSDIEEILRKHGIT